jgi:hypothetical protein
MSTYPKSSFWLDPHDCQDNFIENGMANIFTGIRVGGNL